MNPHALRIRIFRDDGNGAGEEVDPRSTLRCSFSYRLEDSFTGESSAECYGINGSAKDAYNTAFGHAICLEDWAKRYALAMKEGGE